MRPLISTHADLLIWCETGVSEGLQLEFKQRSDAVSGSLTRDEKRTIAQAISSFANSDGGMLVYGIRTARRDGVDVAVELKPIADITRFANEARAVCALNISPMLPNVEISVVDDPELAGAGYLICSVDRSDARPHMSVAPGDHSYYRRSLDGRVPMTPSEVRDQILAVRDAILEPLVKHGGGGSFRNIGHGAAVRTTSYFRLQNVGRTLCRNPFLRIHADCTLHSHMANFDSALGAWKTEFPFGTMIHVDDQMACMALALHGFVRFDALQNALTTASYDLTDTVFMFPATAQFEDHSQFAAPSLEVVTFRLAFGAENAPLREVEERLTRRAFARCVLAEPNVRAMAASSLGSLREEILDRFVAQSD